MSKKILKTLCFTFFLVPAAFADETLSPFNHQGDLSYPEPNTQESFYATRTPMANETRGYFGINFGIGSASLKPELGLTSNSHTYTATTENKNGSNYAFGLYTGIGHNFENFYIGSEFCASYSLLNRKIASTASTPSFVSNTTINIKQPITIGLDIIPGYLTTAKNFLFYARAGIGTSLMQVKLDTINSTAPNTIIEAKANKIASGLRAGFGVEYFFNDSWSIRGEYLHCQYSGKSSTYSVSSSPTVYSYKLDASSTDQFNLGITMSF